MMMMWLCRGGSSVEYSDEMKCDGIENRDGISIEQHERKRLVEESRSEGWREKRRNDVGTRSRGNVWGRHIVAKLADPYKKYNGIL
jgi:hypothetical protein